MAVALAITGSWLTDSIRRENGRGLHPGSLKPAEVADVIAFLGMSNKIVFALPGFTTYRREGIELTSGFTATVNADLKSASSER